MRKFLTFSAHSDDDLRLSRCRCCCHHVSNGSDNSAQGGGSKRLVARRRSPFYALEKAGIQMSTVIRRGVYMIKSRP